MSNQDLMLIVGAMIIIFLGAKALKQYRKEKSTI